MPSAQAAPTLCWFGPTKGKLKVFPCDHTSRVDADGTKIQDLVFGSGSKRRKWSVALYGKGDDWSYAEVSTRHGDFRSDLSVDDEGDFRIDMDDHEFAFRPHWGPMPSPTASRRARTGSVIPTSSEYGEMFK